MKRTPEQVCARFDHLKSARSLWETHWQDCIDYTMPNMQDVITKRTSGSKKGVELFDNTAMTSCEMLASALHGMLTNANTQWFELNVGDPDINELDQVRAYLQKFTGRLHTILNATNFQTEVHQFYLDLCVIGTAIMTIEENLDKIVHFSTKHISECVIAENNLGIVDELLRCFEWDARQILQEFAKEVIGGEDLTEALKDKTLRKKLEDAFTEKVIKNFEEGKSDKFQIIHAVYKSDLLKVAGKTFVSQYVLKSQKDKKELRVNGFKSFPYIVARWTKISGEVYGRSPAMVALPEAKTLNQMMRAVIRAAQKVVDPPTQGPDDGFIRPLKTAPGSHHYYRAGSVDRIEPIFKNLNPNIGFELIRDRQLQIREAFFVDKLNLLQGDRMTTVEVNQRIEEQLRFLSPMLGRQRFEFAVPLVDRVVDITVAANDPENPARNFLGEPPAEIEDVALSVEYTSPIARSQIVTQGQNMVRALEASAPFIELAPQARGVIDAVQAIRENWRIYGAPQRVLLNDKELKEVQEAEAEAQAKALEQQQNMVDAEVVNKTAPALKGK